MMINDGDDQTPSLPNNPKKHNPLPLHRLRFPTSTAAMNPSILPCILLSLAAFSLAAVELTSSASLPLQLIALLSLKSSLNDPRSTFRDWDPLPSFSKPDFHDPVWCTWSGVKCDSGMSHVTSLNLSRRNLSGTIPPELRYLTGLLHLNLSGNSFEGPFPWFIFELMELRTVDISHNSFNSSFTPGISRLKFLKVFNAYSNNFSGPLPEEFTSLRYLKCLNLGGSYFEGKIPPVYGSFPALRSLFLHGNYLEGSVPPEIGSLALLEHLEIGYNLYYGSLPGEFGSLSNLRYLDISSANLSSSLPQEIGNMTRLATLFLFRNQLTGQIPESISRLVALRSLDLSENQITGVIPAGVASFRNLTLLKLMKNKLSGEIPEGIGSLSELSTLLLWNNGLTGMLPQNLGANANLTWVDVSTNLLTGPVPPNLCLGNKLVKLLLFSNEFEDELPKSLVNCTSLFRLRIQGNHLRGAIPRGFGLLPNLTFADFSRNNFSGDIPDDFGNSVALQFLNISGNSFESILPGSIWSVPKLIEFSASSSGLAGPIPDFIGCKSLYKIELGGNSLNGSIPWDIGHCEKLVNLNLSGNSLTGIIPWEISVLPSITEIDLSHNFLTGMIPSNFDNCTTLESFNVSFNSLTGPIPSSSSIFRNLHPSSFLGNEGLCGSVLEKPCSENMASDDPEIKHPQLRRTTGTIVWIMAAAFGVGLIVIIAGGRWCFHSNYRSTLNQGRRIGPWKLTAFQRLNFTAEDVIDYLSMSDKIIGMGSTGTVYRAEMPNGDVIAVKKLWGRPKEYTRKRRGVLAEVDVLGNVRHRNIVRLLGCCSNRECTMLLYEYMPNGNLDDLLHGKNKDLNLVIDWLTRYKIALGVAQGICYLHHDCDPVIVHRDLKPSNILLDAEMEAKVADFGVAKLIQCDESMSVIAGSYGYIAPEYAYTLQVNEKSDIYSYGVVLMEMLCWKRSVDPEFGEGNNIVDWVRSKSKTKDGIYEMLDSNAGASCATVRQEMIEFLRIALLCTASNPADRPSMRDVVMMLQEAGPRRKLAQPFGREDGDPTAKKTDAGC